MRRWLAPFLWACVIELLTSWPNPPSVPAPEGTDKVVHWVLYSVLGVLTMRSAWDGRFAWRAAALVAGGLALFAALDEWHQLFIPGRGMELGDWIADSVGAMAGITLYSLIAGAGLARRESRT
jgi:VanZ family protein